MSTLTFLDRNATRPLYGLSVMYPSTGALERIGGDWDWLWIDAQHGDIDFRDAANLLRVCSLIKKPGIVRIPSQDYGWVGKILDAGGAGVIVPMIESVAEAKAMVQAAKFPPIGNRSYGGRRIIDFKGRAFYKTANQDTLLILQLESNNAVGLADEIAALPGVDGLFLGPDDLFIRDGQDVDTAKTPETIGKQASAVAAACRKHGKINVGHGISDVNLTMAKDYGYKMIVGGGDVGFLAGGSKSAAKRLHDHFKTDPGAPLAAPGSAASGNKSGSIY